jgi:hypothetical protein
VCRAGSDRFGGARRQELRGPAVGARIDRRARTAGAAVMMNGRLS